MAREHRVDVSELAPPEPFERVLATVRTLGDGEYVRMLHRREPFPLYSMLTKLGFAHLARPGTETEVEVLIWRQGDRVAEAACRADGGALS